MTQPIFPLLCHSADDMIWPVPEENYFSKAATSALLDPSCFKGNYLFDSGGNKWTYHLISDEFENILLNPLVINAFNNQLHEAKVIWTFAGTYNLSELKERIDYCIDRDEDDVLTQFEAPSIIKSEIDRAQTFEDIMSILDKYIFSVSEETI